MNTPLQPAKPDADKKPADGNKPRGRVSPRRRARELVVQGLYQWRVGGQDEASIEAHLAETDDYRRADRAMFETLLRGALRKSTELFELLRPNLDRSVDELSPIEASILLLGAYELKHHPETPYRVIINEAIELAKTFGGTDGHKYVNGVLDKLAPKLRAAEVASGGRR
jgi:N utilization substance protein B